MSVCPGCDQPYSYTEEGYSVWTDPEYQAYVAQFAFWIVYTIMLLALSIWYCVSGIRKVPYTTEATRYYLTALITAIIANALAALSAGIDLSGIFVTYGFLALNPIIVIFTQASLLFTILVYAIVARMSRLEKLLIIAGLTTWLIICFAIQIKLASVAIYLPVSENTYYTEKDTLYWAYINSIMDSVFYAVASTALVGVTIRTLMRGGILHRGVAIPATVALIGLIGWCSLQIALDQAQSLQRYGIRGLTDLYTWVAPIVEFLSQTLALYMVPLVFWHVERNAKREADLTDELNDKPTPQQAKTGDWERA